MRILITGATGFLGFHLARRLERDGHTIVACVRQAQRWRERLPAWEWRACDFSCDTQEADWTPRIADVDLVINAVGIIGESGRRTFRQVQTETPRALFSACSRAGVKVLQISALGADARDAATPFLRSKQEADDHLWQLPGDCLLLYPAIVIGQGSNSTALFCRLAALPVVPLPGRGEQRLNPIHIDDFCEAVAQLLRQWSGGKQRHFLTGVDTLRLRELLMLLRDWLELSRAPCLPLPPALLGAAAWVAERVAPAGLLRRDTLTLLASAATPAPSAAVPPPRPLRAALWSRPASPAYRRQALTASLQPLLVASLVFLWLYTGIVSLFANRAAGYALLAGAGVTGPLATAAICTGGLADLALGLLLMSGRQRRRVYLLQFMLMLAYLFIASVLLPSLWLDPLGSLSKTVPLLAVALLLAQDATATPRPRLPH